VDTARKTTIGLTILATLFVLGAAIYTGNAALYLLAGMAAVSCLLAWRQSRRTPEDL
jgi:hypothetical protein